MNNEVIVFVYAARSFKRKAGNEFQASQLRGFLYGVGMELNRLNESFEREIKNKVKSINLEKKFYTPPGFTTGYIVNMDFSYIDSGAQLLWEIYCSGSNEAKKRMKISLPKSKEKPENFYDAGYNEGIEDCRRHIIAQQLTIIEK